MPQAPDDSGEQPNHETAADLTPSQAGSASPQTEQAAEFAEEVAQSTPETPTVKIPDGSEARDLIHAIPQEKMVDMSAKDMDAILAGDPKTIARIFDLPEEAPKPNPAAAQAADDEDGVNQPAEAGKPPKRVYLRGLSPKDAQGVLSMVRDIQDGKFASLDEARAHYAANGTTAPAEPTEQQEQVATAEVSPKIAAIEASIAELTAQRTKASDEFDTPELTRLTEELVMLKIDLREAKKEDEQRQGETQKWISSEAENITTAKEKYAELFKDNEGEFSNAVRDARDLAVLRKDPVLSDPKWPLILADRVHTKLYGTPKAAPQAQQRGAFPARPTQSTRPLGAVATPSTAGVPMLTVQEAQEQIGLLSEEAVDQILANIKATEAAAGNRSR